MKYAKILRILGIAVILSLIVTFTIGAPTLAARVIKFYDEAGDEIEEGAIGAKITITGTGFTPSTETSQRAVDIYFASDAGDSSDYIDAQIDTYKYLKTPVIGEAGDDDEGEFDTTFTVPKILNDGSDNEDVEVGNTYYIYVTIYNSTRVRAFAEFTVTSGEISLDPEKGPVDTLVEITGTDFAADKKITIEFDGDDVDIEEGDGETNSDGKFESVILIPESDAGTQTITVTVSGSEVEAEFTVEPDITLDPQSGEAGAEVSVSGTGFGKRTDISIFFDDSIEVREGVTTRINGSFTTNFIVPKGLENGIYTIEAEDDDDNIAKARFTIIVPPPPTPEPTPTPAPAPTPPPPTANVIISANTGNIGKSLGIGGAGFEAGGKVTIKYDDEAIATVTASADGAFSAYFNVPVSKHGDHTITISDGVSTEKLTFTVESEAPITPEPLLPKMGVEVKSPISFDWKDVTDPSLPVTYTLQIATAKDFDAASIVLEKKLTKSEYTITEDEEAELPGKKDPYYWRIRALDAASNEGEWTGAGIFYVPAAFAMPSWAIYTLIGLGGLFLFALGYWLGRRTTYYY